MFKTTNQKYFLTYMEGINKAHHRIPTLPTIPSINPDIDGMCPVRSQAKNPSDTPGCCYWHTNMTNGIETPQQNVSFVGFISYSSSTSIVHLCNYIFPFTATKIRLRRYPRSTESTPR